jgi:hypothetical protein
MAYQESKPSFEEKTVIMIFFNAWRFLIGERYGANVCMYRLRLFIIVIFVEMDSLESDKVSIRMRPLHDMEL